MKRLLIILEIAVLISLLYWHFKLGVVRYFDADEFAHLHWGYSLSVGERPYTDFFYLFPPFFLYPIASLFKLFGRSVQAIVAARMFIFFIFLATSGVLFLLAKKLRGVHFALTAAILFAFLPLPFDKMIEVRPDLVATGLSMLGLLLFVEGYGGNEGDERKRKKYFFLSGASYAASLGFVPKTVFFLVPVGLVMVVNHLRNLRDLSRAKKNLSYFFLGMIPVGIVLLFLIWSFGNPSFAIYSMTKMASEVTKVLGSKFYMRPDIFFYPNDTYYGLSGWSWPLVATIVIYVVASIWAIHRLMAVNLEGDKGYEGDGEKKSLGEFLVAGSFFANLAAFVYFYPLKHAQYLIPVAPFVAFYAADIFINLIKVIKIIWLRMGMFITVLAVISLVGFQMNQKKASWVNRATFDRVNYFLQTIPADAPIYDMTGESIFFRNGYYFCCIPYGQYEEALYFKIPNLEKELDKRGTKYAHLGTQTRLNEIPSRHAKYIMENFVPMTGDGLLWRRK